jgi:predicted KAP-like P-loop ATPase
MWSDNETERDFLNFSGVADTVAEIIVQASGRPVSIGVSGSWGAGKSSMIKLIQASLKNRKTDGRDFVFVEFDAWLYQGYDDARAALMDVIVSKLSEEAKKREKAGTKVKDLIKRVNWIRVAKLAVPSLAALAIGLPPVGLAGEAFSAISGMVTGDGGKSLGDAETAAAGMGEAAEGMLKPKSDSSPPREIQALRDDFESTLRELGITLVVLIDDLDRCLPPTTVSTLEAIRLFLFLENTAFVIAADTEMIKHAVRRHFEGIRDESLVTNYFDKLIQVPIRVPPLGTQEVRAYLLMLFVDDSDLPSGVKETIRAAICGQLRKSWQGMRVDASFVKRQHASFPSHLVARLDAADRLAPLMTTAAAIGGNPRLIKRFLNALSIRLTIAKAQGVTVDEAVLVKLLLFERLAEPAYGDFLARVSKTSDGKPAFLKEWEDAAREGRVVKREAPWDTAYIDEWLSLQPALAGEDLRGALYVSREHAPLVTPEDRLSSETAELLTGLLTQPSMARALKAGLEKVPRPELNIFMDQLLARARHEESWGAPPILDACMLVAEIDAAQGERLAAFLIELPSAQIRPSIVPKIGGLPWAKKVLDYWSRGDSAKSVKNAISANTAKAKRGDVSV